MAKPQKGRGIASVAAMKFEPSVSYIHTDMHTYIMIFIYRYFIKAYILKDKNGTSYPPKVMGRDLFKIRKSIPCTSASPLCCRLWAMKDLFE